VIILEVRKANRVVEKVETATFDTLTVGSSDKADLTIDDPTASREHLRVTRKRSGFTVRDLGSKNGTWVNGRRVKAGRALKITFGDYVRIGEVVLTLVEIEEDKTAVQQPGLRILNGARQGEIIPLEEGETIVGRGSEAGLALDEATISSKHASIRRDEKGIVYVKDLGSENGTKVNGKPCFEGKVLHDGDTVRFAHVECRFTTDLSKGTLKLSKGQICVLILLVLFGVAGFMLTHMNRPKMADVILTAEGFLSDGRYEAAVRAVREARNPIGSADEKVELDLLLRRATSLLDADKFYFELQQAITNKKWHTVNTISSRLMKQQSALSVNDDEARIRSTQVKKWFSVTEAYLDAERKVGREEIAEAMVAFQRISIPESEWPERFRELKVKVKLESEALVIYETVRRKLKDGDPKGALYELAKLPSGIELTKNTAHLLRATADALEKSAEVIVKVEQAARDGQFDFVRDANFVDKSGELADVAQGALRSIHSEFNDKQNRALGFAGVYDDVKQRFAVWRGTQTPRIDDLCEKWSLALTFANNGCSLVQSIQMLVQQLNSADMRWMSGGKLERELKGNLEILEQRLDDLAGGMLAEAVKLHQGGQRRDCVLAMKLALQARAHMGAITFEPTSKSNKDTLEMFEARIREEVTQLYNEGYMLRFGSEPRLRRMKKIVEIGLPEEGFVAAAKKELDQHERTQAQ